MENNPLESPNKKVPEFIQKQIEEKEGYPIINPDIQAVIDTYGLAKESNFNRAAVVNEDEALNYSLSGKDAEVRYGLPSYQEKKGGSLSFYNQEGTIRLSDHWNTRLDDKANFNVEPYYAYVAQRNSSDKNTWDLIERIPLYKTHPVSIAESNRYLEKYKEKLEQELKDMAEKSRDIFIDWGNGIPEDDWETMSEEADNMYSKINERLFHLSSSNPESIFRFIDVVESEMKMLSETKDLFLKKHGDNLIRIIKSKPLFSEEGIVLANKLRALIKEEERVRYSGYQDISDTSSHW